MKTYLDYGKKMQERVKAMLALEGLDSVPNKYSDFMELDHWLRSLIGENLPLVLSDNYEHFMACLPGKKYAAQHVLIRKMIGGFTVAAGFWKWLEFLSHQITRDEVELVADFFSGEHNGHPRQFDRNYWLHVVDDYDGYLPIRIEYIGEGAVFTGVPFPVAQVYGEKPAVWLNEPMYIQVGQLSHVATVAAQFAEVLGDPWRFIEVAFRAMENKEFSKDMLLAMLIGGGIISTSNDLGAFINGAPFKCSGTTGHCWYQQYPTLKKALRELLKSPLGPYSTVLLDAYKHEHGFMELLELIKDEKLNLPFAERPDSGNTLELGMHDLTVLEDMGHEINVIFEDGYTPSDVLRAERERRQRGLSEERCLFGAGSGFLGPRRALETAYKASHFHDGIFLEPTDTVDTMKICLNDEMKQSIPGLISWFQNEGGIYQIGEKNQMPPKNYENSRKILYDGISIPGKPFFDPDYTPANLTTSPAIIKGQKESVRVRSLLGRNFTLEIGECRPAVNLSKKLREKRKKIYKEALNIVNG